MTILSIILYVLGGLMLFGAVTEGKKRKKVYAIDKEQKPLTGVYIFAFILIFLGWLSWPSGESKSSEPQSEVATHQDSIKRLFSAWDGSDLALVDEVKKNMNDADSFEHVETTYFDLKDHIIINMKYRGKNAFGAKILCFVKAKQNIDGTEVTIIETQP